MVLLCREYVNLGTWKYISIFTSGGLTMDNTAFKSPDVYRSLGLLFNRNGNKCQ